MGKTKGISVSVIFIAGVLVKFLMVGETNSMVGYHLMAEDHSIQLGVLGGAMTFLEKVFEYRP